MRNVEVTRPLRPYGITIALSGRRPEVLEFLWERAAEEVLLELVGSFGRAPALTHAVERSVVRSIEVAPIRASKGGARS